MAAEAAMIVAVRRSCGKGNTPVVSRVLQR
jgi:hypothetical protein